MRDTAVRSEGGGALALAWVTELAPSVHVSAL